MRTILLGVASVFYCYMTNAQIPKVSSGTIKHFESFPSKYVSPRNVDVWLPDGYTPKNKYAVLYMQDGQTLFDSTITWNHQTWGVDKTLQQLIKEGKIKNCIVVGIWNSGATRHTDYTPQKPFESLPKAEQDSLYKASVYGGLVFNGAIHSDNYLRFMVKELKPFIDSAFSVKKDRANTFIGGSSMGGLISLYAICEYPDVFGGAACLSTHWPGIFTTANNPLPDAFLSYLKKHLPNPATHKLYFDHGTETLDSMYAPYQHRADAIIIAGGYTQTHFMTRVFAGADHTERSWAKRFDVPMRFILKVVGRQSSVVRRAE